MAKEKYRLIGSICLFSTMPEFVYPVFEKDGKFYLQVCEHTTIIDDFSEIKKEDHIAMIRPLTEVETILGEIPKEVSHGSDAVIAFQPSEDTIFFGNMSSFRDYIKENPITDEFVNEQIQSLNKRDKNSKQYRKKKEFMS